MQRLRGAVHSIEIEVYDLLASAAAPRGIAAARQQIDASFAALVASTAADAEAGPRVVQAQQHYRDWLANALEPILAEVDTAGPAAQRGERLQALAQRFGALDRQAGLPLMDLIDRIGRTAYMQLQQHSQALDGATRVTEISVFAMLGLGVLVVILALWLSGRLIVQPIRELTGLMSRLAAHDHDLVVPQQQRGDEVGAIARALEVFKSTAITTYWQNWNKTAISEVAAALQRCTGVAEFADAFCAEMARRLQAGVAIFFHYDEENR